MSFNTFGKAGKFLELNFGPGIFWGFSWEVQGYYCVLVFALIRSSLSLEILSSPPPPSPGMLLDKNESISFHWELKSLFVHSVQVLRMFFFFVVLSTSMATLPVHHFFPSLFSQGN